MGVIKEVSHGKEFQEKLLSGVELMANAVGSTLGPGGRHVMISDGGLYGGRITKDGVTVAKAFGLSDPVEDMAVQFMKNVSQLTDDRVGDGTTTSMILANEMLKKGFKDIEKGDNMYEYTKGMRETLEEVLSTLKDYKHDIDIDGDNGIEELRNVASISSNGDNEIVDAVMEAVSLVGNDGSIKVNASRDRYTSVEKKEGLSYAMGMLSPFMVTNKVTNQSILEDAYVLVTDIKLNSLRQLSPILDNLEGKALFVVVDEIDNDVLTFIAANVERRALNMCVVKAPGFGNQRKEYLEDIAVVTGSKPVFKGTDKEPTFDMSVLGSADKVVTGFNDFTIIGGNGNEEKIKDRIKSIKEAYEEENDGYYKDRFNERYAKMKGGIAVIRIGATSDIEMYEKKYRFMDAIYSVKNALDGGYIVGGGIALYKIGVMLNSSYVSENDSYDKGVITVLSSILKPLEKLYENIGISLDNDLETILNDDDFEFGRDLKTMEMGNLVDIGVIDAYKVVENTLRNSVSISSTLITTDYAVYAVGDSSDGGYKVL